MFWGYFTGAYAPPWDFMGSYNTEAYAWWTEGSFFSPANWISHSWGGYPAAASIQNSAWYLPVGLFALITPFTIHASAALAALHYAFGAAGVYVLGRFSGLGRIPSTFGLVAYFFVAGFYDQAEFVDIARGYAWLPWLLVCTSARWPWRRWWGVPLAALVFWQALLGTYPGMIVAAAYCGLVWVVVQQFVNRTRFTGYLLPLAVAGAAAVALLAPKYVPALLLASGSNAGSEDVSQLSWSLVATAFFPYGSPRLPTDIALRSFFLPATCFVLAGLVRLRSWFERATLGVLVTALALGLPGTPWHDLVTYLPGMSFSRYRMSDFRSFILLATCLLAMGSLSRILERPRTYSTKFRRSDIRVAVWLAGIPLLVLTLALINQYDASEWAVPFLVVATVSSAIWMISLPIPDRLHHYRLDARLGAVALVALSLISGVSGAYSTQAPWRSPRIFAETQSFGATVADLLGTRHNNSGLRQQPARTPLPEPVVATEMMHPRWNSGFYHGTDSVGGYVNLKRSPSFIALETALLDPARSDLVNYFVSAPGMAVALVDGALPSRAAIDSCLASGRCGTGLDVNAAGYSPGRLTYSIRATDSMLVVLNDSYYPGWHIQVCEEAPATACHELQAAQGPAGMMVVQIPAGNWQAHFEYIPPGSRKAWFAFVGGVVLLGLWSLFTSAQHVLSSRKRRLADEPRN